MLMCWLPLTASVDKFTLANWYYFTMLKIFLTNEHTTLPEVEDTLKHLLFI